MGRVGWILAGGAAIIGGMIFQDRGLFGVDVVSDDGKARSVQVHVAEKVEGKTEGLIDRIVADHGGDITVENDKGQRVELDAATKKRLATTVGELLKAEARLALYDFKNEETTPEAVAARARRDALKAEVDAMEKAIEAQSDVDAARTREIRDEVRDRVRNEVRDAVRN